MDKTVDDLIRRTGQLIAYSNYKSIYGGNHEFGCIVKEVERMKHEREEKLLRDAHDSLIYSQPLLYVSSSGMGRRISDVNILVPNKVVEVNFMDGDKQKAVCQEPDVFSLEHAISICITKHLLGGSGAYNKAVKNGVKVYEEKQRAERMAKAEEKRIAKRRAKKTAYKKRKEEKRREEQIEIQKEAYVRALKEVGKVNANQEKEEKYADYSKQNRYAD